MKRQLSLSGPGLALVLALAGCGGEAGSPDAGAAANDADVQFVSMMIPHHEQAVEMSGTLLAKDGIDPEVTDLAGRIEAAQGPEIETMSGWLDAWGEPEAGGGGHGSGHGSEHGSGGGADAAGGDGMMSGEQMDDLAAAEGDEASRMFLDAMIEHHEGAVDMAKQELDAGAHADAKELAASIVQAQEAEIKEMEALLAGL
jgi:uncharacterized protein (DUF305 family)